MKSRLKIIIALVFILLTTGFLYSQSPYFRQISGLNDFGNVRINCLHQDHQGFIWIGTNNGVYKFDGINATLIQTLNSSKTPNITSIAEDENGKLWFGYENGQISNFDPINNNYDTLIGQNPQSKITNIKILNDNSIIFGTYGEGVYIWKENLLINHNQTNGLSDDYIYTMISDNKGRIWLGTDNGINICDFSGEDVKITHLTVDDGLPDFIIQTLAKDEDGNIWIGTHDKGVCYYNPKQNKFIVSSILENWSYGPVKDILILDDRIWIATENSGIIEYQARTNRLVDLQTDNEIILGRINSLLQDKEGNIWVISTTEIYISFGPKLEFLSKSSDEVIDNIHALTVDSKDNVWYANDHGLFRFNPNISEKKYQFQKYPLDIDLGSQKIMSLYEDSFGFIWIGTFGKGIIRLNPKTGKQTQITEQQGLVNGNILSIKGSDSDIWLATLGGATKCRISDKLANIDHIPQFENYQEEEGLGNNFIYHIYIDEKNRVWFATDGSGVSYFENGTFKNLPDKTGLNGKVIYSITGDQYSNIWMDVAHEGIYKFNGSEVIPYLDDPSHKNLSFSGIHSIGNELVMVYDDGIDLLNIQSGEIIHYEENAGLKGNNANLNTIDLDSKGTVWIGTSQGLVKYQSGNKSDWTQPVAKINEVSVYLESINQCSNTEFKYSDNHFSFDFSGLWFQYPEKVEYLIKLEGHDLNWINTKNQSVIYSNLKPGDYTFQVKAALYDNFETASSATYTFTISKPFWTAVWFYVFMAVIIALLLFLYIRFREKRLKQKQAAIQEKIKFQFENLKSQINPHFLFNSFSTLIALIESDQEEAIEYVDELSTLFRNILEYRDQDTISIEEELSIIDNYYQLQRKRYGGNLELKIEQNVQNESFKIPPMTLQLLIENAIKHNVVSKNKPLKIKVYLGEEPYLFVENNLQLKNDEVKSTGIGIQNIIDRYKLITDKEILITQTENLFKVGLPIIR